MCNTAERRNETEDMCQQIYVVPRRRSVEKIAVRRVVMRIEAKQHRQFDSRDRDIQSHKTRDTTENAKVGTT